MTTIDINSLGDSIKSQVETSQKALSSLFADQKFNLESSTEQEFLDILIDKIGKDDIFNKKFKEAFSKIIDKYKELGQQLDSMRSTFLPIELVRGIKKDVKNIKNFKEDWKKFFNEDAEVIPNTKHYSESYENTFLRMLGLPESSDVKDFIYYDIGRQSYVLASDIEDVDRKMFSILEERQTYIRKVYAKNNVFDTELYDSLDERLKEVFSTEEDQDFLTLIQDISLEFKEGLKKAKTQEEISEYSAFQFEISFIFGIPEGKEDLYDSKLRSLFPGKNNPTQYAYNEIYNFYVLEKQSIQPNLANVSNDFEKFMYLLLPPVQDARIAGCISEPSKIVKKPFGTTIFLKVNGEEPKTSLLESVIRIRLDKLTGYDPLISGTVGINPFKNYRYVDVKDSYGFVENFFINRLYSTLNFLSEKLIDDIEDYLQSTEITGKIVVETTSSDGVDDKDNPNSNKSPDAGSNPESKAQSKSKSSSSKTAAGKEKEAILNQLNIIKDIDDTIKILLSSNETLDIQAGTFRSASLSKGQFMGVLNSLVTAPGALAQEKIKQIKKEDDDDHNKQTGPQGQKAEISLNLGINRGIGLIDLVSFTLAMFLLSEDYLIGMLTEEQFKNLKDSYPTFNFFRDFKKPTVTESVIEYTKKIIGVYEFCKDIMKNEEV